VHWSQRVAVLYLGALALVIWGYGIGAHKIWPYGVFKEIKAFVKGDPEEGYISIFGKLSNDFGGMPARKLVKLVKNKKRIYVESKIEELRDRRMQPLLYQTSKATLGLRLIFGTMDFQKGLAGAVLLDEKGQIRHRWFLNEDGLSWDILETAARKFPHGIQVYPDGSLIFAYDQGASIQKFDRCSQRIWAQKAKVDHSIHSDGKGNVWVIESPKHIGLYDIQSGKEKRRLNMMNFVESNTDIDPLAIRQRDYSNHSYWNTRGGGYWHPNDVEPLLPHMASAFPQFEVGDLLISLRSINLIFVVSPESFKIRWWRMGAWRRQHDPDWQPDGTITVYNNNMHRGHSQIIKIDPKTYHTQVLYEGRNDQFYTWMRGKHQVLENGHIIITSPQQGRAFEVDQQGKVVFEWINRYDQKQALLVSEMIHLDSQFFTLPLQELSKCPSNAINKMKDAK
jgi:hypothetical protein